MYNTMGYVPNVSADMLLFDFGKTKATADMAKRMYEAKKEDSKYIHGLWNLKTKNEIAQQIQALKDMKEMAATYGYDISRPATSAKEAIQWTYFGYLAAIKTQNGAAMSVGRVSTFFDIYIEKDLIFSCRQ